MFEIAVDDLTMSPKTLRMKEGVRENDMPYKDSETCADGLRRKAGNRKKDCRTLGGEYGNGR